GEECFIQSGQGTDEIQMYIGFSPADIVLHVADAYGCSTNCAATLECNTPAPNPIVGTIPSLNPVTLSNPVLVNGISKVDEVKSPKLTQLNLWPNPARGTVNVSFDADMDQEVNFTLTNLMGQIMLVDKFDANRGFNTYKLDVSGIPEGSYMMGLKTTGEMYTKIVVVLRHE
ncbi:MAG: T9SS type A sorting domain-containing protein, partial [Saprospiraceae bacterium]